MITTPEPGIYENIPFGDYIAWDAINNSMLSHAKKSLAQYRKARRDGSTEETDAMRFGTLCHTGKLEPLVLMERYVVRPRFEDSIRKSDGGRYENPRMTSAYKAEVASWRTAIGDKIEVTQVELDNMTGVVKSLASHDRAREYLEGAGPTEASFIWIDQQSGLRCKGRCDKLKLREGMIGDLKTTRDVCGFEGLIPKFSYHRQAAFYIDGIATLTGVVCRFGLVAAESSDPFGVRAAPLSEAALLIGREEYEGLLAAIAVAQQENDWPGPDSPDEWQLPGWALPRTEPVELDWSGVTFAN